MYSLSSIILAIHQAASASVSSCCHTHPCCSCLCTWPLCSNACCESSLPFWGSRTSYLVLQAGFLQVPGAAQPLLPCHVSQTPRRNTSSRWSECLQLTCKELVEVKYCRLPGRCMPLPCVCDTIQVSAKGHACSSSLVYACLTGACGFRAPLVDKDHNVQPCQACLRVSRYMLASELHFAAAESLLVGQKRIAKVLLCPCAVLLCALLTHAAG